MVQSLQTPPIRQTPENFVMSSTLQSTLRELQTILRMSRMWLVFAAILALFVATGPFGTLEELDLAGRLGYWFIVQTIAGSIALCLVSLFYVLLADHLRHTLA